MNQPTVAIVYLAYNSRPYLKDVVLSLQNLNYSKESLQIIIVDNNSPDDSASMIREQVLPELEKDFPHVTFFPNPENTGFAGGCNIGIDHALLANADYVYLLNNDAKFHPDAIREAVYLAESDEKIGSVQSLMLLWQDELTVNSTGGMVQFLGFGYVRDNGRKHLSVRIKDGQEIAYASGAAVLYRASTLRKVGNLDGFLFLYHEDLELGWRIRLTGARNVISMKSIVYHKYEFKRSIQKFFWMERNRFLVHAFHLKVATLLLLLPFMICLEVALIIFSIRGKWSKEKLLSYVDILRFKTIRHILAKRKESKILRTVSDKEICKLFVARIDHQETSNAVIEWVANPALTLIWFLLKRLIVW
ncbi:MAG: glycosyltransferase family 2 protein [Patescibacteria group bacterium]